jgi:hypothetical protein
MPRLAPRCIVPLLLLTFAPIAAGAQGDPPTSRLTFWASAGYGYGAAGQYAGMEEAASVNLSAQRGRMLLSLRAAGVTSSIFDWSSDIGLLAGLATSPASRFHAGAALGVGGAHTTGPDGIRFTIPAEVQLAWRFAPYVGLALYGFAALNGDDSFGGVTIAVQAGRLR